MEFRIADTFTASLNRLTGEEQKAVKTAAFDLQINPAHPSFQLHKIEKSKDANFSSVRVNLNVRLIVHRTGQSLLLCYVDHHDAAYQWAERRKLETHPKTGAAQLVEVRETVQDVIVPRYVEVAQPAPPKPRLFAAISDEALLGYGVPPEWLGDVRNATDDTVLDLAAHLPSEASEALLDLAIGATPKSPDLAPAGADPFAHPDAQRRFRVMSNVEELERALDYPWEKWSVFLHPAQRQLVERDYSGPARVSGSAGTGKTIVALHRAVHLARANPESRVLLTTFSDTLANALHAKLRALLANQPRLGERVDVYSMSAIGRRLFELNFGPARLAEAGTVSELLQEAVAATPGAKFSPRFLQAEWDQVVDAWQLDSWEAYRDVVRLGRRTRLPENQRAILWSIFSRVRIALEGRGLVTGSAIYSRLAAKFAGSTRPPFDFVVVDEAQDVDVAQLRFLAALGAGRSNRALLRWRPRPAHLPAAFLLEVTRRRCSRPFHNVAHKLPHLSSNPRAGRSAAGSRGVGRGWKYRATQLHDLALQWPGAGNPGARGFPGGDRSRCRLAACSDQSGLLVARDRCVPSARPRPQLGRARAAVTAEPALGSKLLDESVDSASGYVSIGTMHLAKGLEFRAVVLMACDDEVIPLQERIEGVADDGELEEVYNTERHLLYVACTRARDYLMVTAVEPASEFLDDLK